jgi:hypothetical protein
MFKRRSEDNMNAGVKRDMVSGHGLLKKGEMVVYEGEKAEVIGVNPLLIIKLENRVLCGALHNHIEYEGG